MEIINKKNGINVKKLFGRYLIVPLLSLAFLFTVVTTHAIAQGTPELCPTTKDGISTIKKGRIESIAADQSSLQVQCNSPSDSKPITISVKKPELQAILQRFSSGDFVNPDYDMANELKNLSVATSRVDGLIPLFTLVGTGLLLYGITFLIILGTRKNLNHIFVGQDKRLSNSKSQMAIWFFVLLIGYISLSFLRVIYGDLGLIGGIGIPQNLLLLSGVSALTYAGAKIITQSQVDSKPGSKRDAERGETSLANFVTDDDGNTDFGDLQMTMITLLAVVVYLFQLFNFLGVLKLYKSVTLPDVDTTILSIFGLSQGAYLAKKAAVATGAQEAIKLGAKGEEVKKLKTILNQKLGNALTPPLNDTDDTFDQATEDAVKLFQSNNKNSLNPTGIVDLKTREKLGL